MLHAGGVIPIDFELEVVRSGHRSRVPFKDLLGRPVVVSLHMRNNTPACDRQIDALITGADEIERRGFGIIAISRDTCGSHLKYAAAKGVPFVLVSDPEDRFATAADAMVAKSMYGRSYVGPARSVFVLDTQARVLGLIEQVDTKAFLNQVLTVLDRLEAGRP